MSKEFTANFNFREMTDKPYDYCVIDKGARTLGKIQEETWANYTPNKNMGEIEDSDIIHRGKFAKATEKEKYGRRKSEIFLTELLRQLKDGLWTAMRDEALEWKEKEE